ncbi:MAG: PIN domain-containing protein [Ruminococcus sp.]|nr:PIN domain-containing protein [Ruminococcus sp.]
MRVLIDTNVLLDYIANRAPYADAAEQIIILCKDNKIEGGIAAHSMMNIFYILRKNMSVSERKDILFYLSQITEIIGIDKQKILNSIGNDDFSDFEDCLQAECAKSFSANWIVTRNIKDFESSVIKAITPDEFLKILK